MGSTEQEIFLPFKLHMRKTKASLPPLFLFFFSPTRHWRNEISAFLFHLHRAEVAATSAALLLICGAPGKPIPGDTCRDIARGRGAAEPQQCPGKGCSRGCTYLLGMLELDVEPTRLDHCLTSCPRSAPKKRPEPILLTSSVPALFPSEPALLRGEQSAQVRAGEPKARTGRRCAPAAPRVPLPVRPCPAAMPSAPLPAAPLLTGTSLPSSQMAHVSKARRLAPALAAAQDHDLPQWDE